MARINPVFCVLKRENVGSGKTTPKPIRRINGTVSRYNTPAIALAYCVTKCCGIDLGPPVSRTGQPRLIVDHERTGSTDEILPWLKRIVIPLNNCTTLIPQFVVLVEYIGDLHHRVKIRVCHTIGDDQTADNCAGVMCTVDVDITSEGMIF